MASPGARDEQPTQQGQEATPPLRPATVSCCSRCCTVEVWSSALSSIWAVVLISSQIFLFGISSVVFLFAAIVVSGLFATLVAIIYGWVLLRVRAQVHARAPGSSGPLDPWWHDSDLLAKIRTSAYALTQLARTFIWCALYVYVSSLISRDDPSQEWRTHDIPWWYPGTERIFLWNVQIDYAAKLYFAPNKKDYLFSLPAMLDLFTFPLPYILMDACNGVDPRSAGAISHNYLIKFGFFRFLRLYGTMPIMKKVFSGLISHIRLKIIAVVLAILSVMCTVSGFMFYLESPAGSFFTTFYDFLYFTIVTMSTVGYGDFSPTMLETRLIMVGCIGLTLGWIPSQFEELGVALAQPPTRIGSPVTPSDSPHIAIVGPVSFEQFVKILDHIYSDPEETSTKITLLTPLPLEQYDLNYLQRTSRIATVSIVSGDVCCGSAPSDIFSVDLSAAKSIFCFSGFPQVKPGLDDNDTALREDKHCIMRMLALQKMLPNMDCVIAQLNTAQQRQLASDMLYSGQQKCDKSGTNQARTQLACLNELKMQMLAASCAGFRGVVPFVYNMVDYQVGNPEAVKDEWQKQYLEGLNMDIYRVVVDGPYANQTLTHITRECYKDHGVIFFAARRAAEDKLWINPSAQFILNKGDFAYFLGNEAQHADVANAFANAFSNTSPKAGDGARAAQDLQLLKTSKRKLSAGVKLLNKEAMSAGAVLAASKSDNATAQRTKMLAEDAGAPGGAANPCARYVAIDIHQQEIPAKPAARTHAELQLHSVTSATTILICGWPHNLETFLLTLRAQIPSQCTVVVLAREVPRHSSLQRLEPFKNCVFVKGNPLTRADLVRAGVRNAVSCVVFKESAAATLEERAKEPKPKAPTNHAFGQNAMGIMGSVVGDLRAKESTFAIDKTEMKDVDVILVTAKVKASVESGWSKVQLTSAPPLSPVHIVTEFHREESVRFVDESHWWQTPNQAGQVCCCPIVAGGRAYADSFLYSALPAMFFMPALVSIIEALVGGATPLDNEASSPRENESCTDKHNHIMQVPLRPDKVNLPLRDIFNDLLDAGYILVGLYRTDPLTGGNESVSYMHTGPSPVTLTRKGDELVIISRIPSEFVNRQSS